MIGKLSVDAMIIGLFVLALTIPHGAILLITAGLLALLLFTFIYVVLKLYNEGNQYNRKDTSATRAPIPQTLSGVVDWLQGNGFTWFGNHEYQGNTLHYFIDAQRITIIEMMVLDDKTFLIATNSFLNNDFGLAYGLATEAPLPFNVNAPHIRQWVIGGSLEDLIHTHREQMERYQFQKGTPIVWEGMAHFMQHNRTHRASFGREVYHSLVFWDAILTTIWIVGYIVFLFHLFANSNFFFESISKTESVLTLAIKMLNIPGYVIVGGTMLLLSALLFGRWLWHDLYLWMGQRKTRTAMNNLFASRLFPSDEPSS